MISSKRNLLAKILTILCNSCSKSTKLSACYNSIIYITLFFVISNRLMSSLNLDLYFAKHFFQNITGLFAIINLFLFIKQKQYKYVFIIFITLILGILVKLNSGSSIILFFLSFTVAFARLDYKYSMYVFISSISTFALITFTFSSLEITDDIVYAVRENTLRETFGFGHPNALGGLTFIFCLTFWCINNQHIYNFISLFFSIFFLIFLQIYVDSRTSQQLLYILILITLLYEIALVFDFNEDKFFNNLVIKSLLLYTFAILTIGFILFVYFYNSESVFYCKLDRLFSNRLSLSHNAFNSFNLTLFGQKLNLSDEDPFSLSSVSAVKYMVLDPFCISILFKNGIVSLLFFGLSFTLITYKAIKNKIYKIAIALSLITIYGLMENKIATISFNIFLFMGMMSFKQFRLYKNTVKIPFGR